MIQQISRVLEVVPNGGFARAIVPIEHVHFREWADLGVELGRVARYATQYEILDHVAVLSCQKLTRPYPITDTPQRKDRFPGLTPKLLLQVNASPLPQHQRSVSSGG